MCCSLANAIKNYFVQMLLKGCETTDFLLHSSYYSMLSTDVHELWSLLFFKSLIPPLCVSEKL